MKKSPYPKVVTKPTGKVGGISKAPSKAIPSKKLGGSMKSKKGC
jgi:hypothetical protein